MIVLYVTITLFGVKIVDYFSYYNCYYFLRIKHQCFKYNVNWLNPFEEKDYRKLTDGSGGRQLLALGDGSGGGSGGRVTRQGQPLPGLSGARRGLVLKLPIVHIFAKSLPFLPLKSFLFCRKPFQNIGHATYTSMALSSDLPTSCSFISQYLLE